MPKPGKHNKPPSWKSQYNEHDFRTNNEGPSNHIRKVVTFKQNRRSGGKGTNKDWGASLRSHLEDEDIDMGVSNFHNSRNINHKNFKKNNNNKGGKRQGSPISTHHRGKLLEGPNNWYRVTLPYGTRYDKELILRMLVEKIAPLELIPIAWQANGAAVIFYVDDYQVAAKLYLSDREMKYPDGYKVIIKVFSGTPNVDITATFKEKLKVAMSKRYNAMIKGLDLTRFHIDPDLRDIFCALFKPLVFNAIVDIIAENIPDLEALNLHDNKLQMISHFKDLGKKLPNLKILHMGNNKIRDVSMFDCMSGTQIVDLVLDGNPLCDKFKEKEKYISEVRKRFPKVLKLDGIELPPPISFDLEEDMPLPATQQTFLCNQEGQGIVRQFLEQYFQIFDSDNRQPLSHAYHESAMYSMTMNYPYGMHQKNSPGLNWYITDNRNLMRIQDGERRMKLLKNGQLAIVSFLNDMPRTKHDIHSFTVDLSLFTPQMMVLTVSGMFKELGTGSKHPPIRFFFKTLVIVPVGAGFCIANEVTHITNATEEQMRTAFKAPLPVPAVSVPTTSTTSTAPPVVAPIVPTAEPDVQTKQQMVQMMAEQSGMNLDWSQKCLEESGWDFQKAAFVFTELNKRKQIPAEAFVK